MTSNNKSFLQDSFLNTARVNHIPVTLFLVNGFQQRGVIESYDDFTVLVVNEGIQHLIYKSAISTIVPQKSIAILNSEEE